MILNHRNTPLYYTDRGTGTPIILLHGFLESSNIWKPFIPELSKKRRVITIDLPGHGKSGTMGAVHTMEGMALAVKAVMDSLGIMKASLVGHSMGGYVSLAFIESFPEKTRSILLLNSTPDADNEEKIANRRRSVRLVKKHKGAYISMAISNLLTEENNLRYRKELEKMKAEAITFPTEGIIANIEGMKIRTSKKETLREFNNEKIIVCGKNDPIMNWELTKKTAEQCECSFILTENGHLSHLEDKTEIGKMLHFID